MFYKDAKSRSILALAKQLYNIDYFGIIILITTQFKNKLRKDPIKRRPRIVKFIEAILSVYQYFLEQIFRQDIFLQKTFG